MTILVILFRPLCGILIGILGAWVASWFFSDLILNVFSAIGVTGIKVWQLGGFLGFVASFFKGGGNVTNNILNVSEGMDFFRRYKK